MWHTSTTPPTIGRYDAYETHSASRSRGRRPPTPSIFQGLKQFFARGNDIESSNINHQFTREGMVPFVVVLWYTHCANIYTHEARLRSTLCDNAPDKTTPRMRVRTHSRTQNENGSRILNQLITCQPIAVCIVIGCPFSLTDECGIVGL